MNFDDLIDYVGKNADTAVALSYDGDNAPVISAKGEQQLAQAIIQLAIENNVPVLENRSLATRLNEMDLLDSIPKELYQIIAEIISCTYILAGEKPKQ